jgi:hypothetical protein
VVLSLYVTFGGRCGKQLWRWMESGNPSIALLQFRNLLSAVDCTDQLNRLFQKEDRS